MKYCGTLLTVRNMETSRQFYQDVLSLDVVADFGANITLQGGVSLQTLASWQEFIHTPNIVFQNNAVELYYEEDDLDAFLEKLSRFDLTYVHPVVEHSWGQRAIRFYDPDYHIIEVAENLVTVINRFLSQGLTPEQTAARMNVPLDFILNYPSASQA